MIHQTYAAQVVAYGDKSVLLTLARADAEVTCADLNLLLHIVSSTSFFTLSLLPPL